MSTKLSTNWQIALSLVVVLTAAAGVGGYAVFGDGGAGPQEMDGHVHGAGAPAGDELRPVHLGAERERRIGITYATAERRAVERTVRTVASVTYDETRVAKVSPRIHGWVERIHVDFLGTVVRQGDPLVELYSPELVTAQEELLLARSLLEETSGEPGSRAYRNAERLLESARQRLDYWEISADQIAELEETGRPRRSLVLRAPSSGIVVEKNAFAGAHVNMGSLLYAVADLSRVWVEGEVFEKDLSLVRVGQPAHVRMEAYPGETFHGSVGYVYPTVSVQSRTGRVRVELNNPEGRLKPGMYAEIHLDVPGDREVVVVPRTAVLSTGERDVVFVRASDGTLVPREVTLGLPAGREIEVLAGLEAGDVVVSSAGFLVDAESNLGAAMDHLDGDAPGPADPHAGHDPNEGQDMEEGTDGSHGGGDEAHDSGDGHDAHDEA
jgi:membrane fusion protein, copper/silver efflux system